MNENAHAVVLFSEKESHGLFLCPPGTTKDTGKMRVLAIIRGLKVEHPDIWNFADVQERMIKGGFARIEAEVVREDEA